MFLLFLFKQRLWQECGSNVRPDDMLHFGGFNPIPSIQFIIFSILGRFWGLITCEIVSVTRKVAEGALGFSRLCRDAKGA